MAKDKEGYIISIVKASYLNTQMCGDVSKCVKALAVHGR